MTSGIQGNSDAAKMTQLPQTGQLPDANQAANKTGIQESAIAGFEDLINENTQGASKKEGSSSTKETTKSTSTTKSSTATSVQDASATATAQAVKGVTNKGEKEDDSPSLPMPSTTVNGVTIRKGMGTLALMGLIMSLLAQASAKSWSMEFQQQCQNIQSQMEMAPAIGDAIREQANQTAKATEAQAKQSLISGIVNITSFCVSVGVGILGAAKATSGIKNASFTNETASASVSSAASKASSSISSAMTSSVTSSAKSAVSGAASAASSTATKLTSSMSANASDVFGKVLNQPGWRETLSRGFNVVKNQGTKALGFANRAVTTAVQSAQFLHGLTAGIEGIAGGIIGAEVAAHQRAAGAAEAHAEELKLMTNIYSQYASQAGQLQEKSREAFSEALQTLRQIAESNLQTTAAIFS